MTHSSSSSSKCATSNPMVDDATIIPSRYRALPNFEPTPTPYSLVYVEPFKRGPAAVAVARATVNPVEGMGAKFKKKTS